MFSNILGGAAGFPVANLGDEISQSLRFGDNKLLTNSLSALQSDWTLSVWFKYSLTGPTSERLMFTDSSGGNYFSIFNDKFYWFPVYSGSIASSPLIRDPSAWYHLVIRNTSSGTTIYLNGESVITGSSAGTTNYFNKIGGNQNGNEFDGYMADIRVVDGSALTPTSFGRYQEDGVWVPDSYTGTYGNEGFHLDFADGSDPGNDVSGNNNDFTATGFDTATVAKFSQFCTTNTSFSGSQPASNGFDGNTGTESDAAGQASTNTAITFAPVPPIDISGKTVRLNTTNTDSTITLGGASTSTSSGWNTVDKGSATQISTTTPLVLTRDSQSSSTGFTAIEVGGTTLVDNTDNDVDFNDTPTSNYATLNPLVPANLALSGANLTTSYNSVNIVGNSTIAVKDSGKYYWEIETDFSTSYNVVGIGAPGATDWIPGPSIVWTSILSSPTQIIQDEGDFTASNSTVTTPYVTGDVLGWALDLDNNSCEVFQNGTSRGTFDIDVGDHFVAPIVGNSNASPTTHSNSINYGQMPFIYTPPTGFSALQTNNLPEPTIKNGSDHFRALTGTGANILAIAQGTNTSGTNWNDDVDTGFTNGLWWIKDRDNSNQHQLVDSVRGSNSALNCPNLTVATYSAPSGNSVAWCWKAGDSTVSNTDGTITADVCANTDAGFSIIDWTGTDTAGTVGHGLTEAPEFIINKNSDNATSGAFYAWHTGIPATQYLAPGSNAAAATSSAVWNNTAPTNSVISLGTAGNGDDGPGRIMYAWHSVPGYSAFGSYTGNNNADGPFVYLGFRPAFVMLKRTNATSSWIMYDSTRSTANPTELFVYADTTAAETNAIKLDFLSNGFKLRDVSDPMNRSSNYIYMAFAENPFGGENAAPATAR